MKASKQIYKINQGKPFVFKEDEQTLLLVIKGEKIGILMLEYTSLLYHCKWIKKASQLINKKITTFQKVYNCLCVTISSKNPSMDLVTSSQLWKCEEKNMTIINLNEQWSNIFHRIKSKQKCNNQSVVYRD